jgi:hypothetical protein
MERETIAPVSFHGQLMHRLAHRFIHTTKLAPAVENTKGECMVAAPAIERAYTNLIYFLGSILLFTD